MEKEVKLWGLNVDNINDIEDIKRILKAMDLFITEDYVEYSNVKDLFNDSRKPQGFGENTSVGI